MVILFAMKVSKYGFVIQKIANTWKLIKIISLALEFESLEVILGNAVKFAETL